MSKRGKQLGRTGEHFAIAYVARRGFHVLFTNYHTRYGEIDLIAEREGVIHCIEVKTRRTQTYGSALESVGEAKLRRFWQAMNVFIEREHISGPCQGDVLTLEKRGGRWAVGWHDNVVEDDPSD